jgi:hypothetical protein
MASAAKQRAKRLRIAAGIILVLGIFGADLVYWMGTRSKVFSDNPVFLTNEKEQSRQEEILIGKQAGIVDAWMEDLKHPKTQAIIIVVAAALVAGGCFYFAGLQHNLDNEESGEETKPP